MNRLLRQVFRNRDGVATIELALVAPVLAVMTIGIVDISTAYSRKLELEQAVQRAIERVQQTTTDTTVEENIKQEVASGADISQDNVTVSYSLTCNGADKDATLDCDAGQTEVRYLDVRATDTFTPMLPLAALGMSQTAFDIEVESGLRTT